MSKESASPDTSGFRCRSEHPENGDLRNTKRNRVFKKKLGFFALNLNMSEGRWQGSKADS